MKKRTKAASIVLLLVALVLVIHPAPKVKATSLPVPMVWMATANWLGCDQNGPTPECADYGTPTGSTIMMTCCVPQGALGTSDTSACSSGGTGRGRTEL